MVKQNLIDILIKTTYFKFSWRNYDTNKTVVKHTDNTWKLDLLDMIDY